MFKEESKPETNNLSRRLSTGLRTAKFLRNRGL